MKTRSITIIIIYAIALSACKAKKHNPPISIQQTTVTTTYNDSAIEIALADSNLLQHFSGTFYKNKFGLLYEKTIAQRQQKGSQELIDCIYFTSMIPQDIDPMSFEQLGDSWYAADKNTVYYYRPISGGMQITKMKDADRKSFKVLIGDYRYAIDNNNVYEEQEILKGFNPHNMVIHRDKQGRIIAIMSNGNCISNTID